jgi:long-chain fatty acid transport protein
MRRTTILLIALATTAFGPTPTVLAGGTGSAVTGVAPLGMADAWTALADGSAAVFVNPAGLAGTATSSLEAGVTRITMTEELSTGDGTSYASETDAILPALFAADTMQSKTWVFGLGLAYPEIAAIDWADGSPLDKVLADFQQRTLDLRATLAYRIGPSFSLAAGVDYYRKSVTAERDDAGSSGRWRFSGDGDTLGFHAAAKLAIGAYVSVGLAYRSPASIDTAGDVSLLDAAGETVAEDPASWTTEIPAQARLGLAFILDKTMALEADVEWTDWSSHEPLLIAPDSAGSEAVFDSGAAWDDTLAWRIGVAWHADTSWTLRAGYFIDPSPVPGGVLDPVSPGGDQRGFAFGFGYREGSGRIDVGYRLADSESRETPEGSFSSSRQSLAASVTFLF